MTVVCSDGNPWAWAFANSSELMHLPYSAKFSQRITSRFCKFDFNRNIYVQVFRTSAHQSSCTIGIWAAYSPDCGAIVIDTEGMLGTSSNENQRTRLLLKVLAISDIVIYRTRAERLHNDLFTFLGDASEAYWKYFTPELKAASERCKLNVPLSTLGPSVIIFHETQHTEVLGEGATLEERKKSSRRSTTESKESQPTAVLPTESSSKQSSQDQLPVASLLEDDGSRGTEPCSNEISTEDGPAPVPTVPMSAEELLRIRWKHCPGFSC